MVFTELRFLLFFAAVTGAYWSLRKDRHRKQFALLASWTFYGLWDWRFLSLIFISTLVDFVVGLRMHITSCGVKRRRLLWVSLLTNLGILGFFKYFDFFSGSAADFFGGLGVTINPVLLDLVLPVGISFYTFQTLSYTIDVYRERLKPTKSMIDFALFVAFFPQLVAGPIVRAVDFLPQLNRTFRWSDVDKRAAMTLFMVGFFKKAVVADNIAPWVDSYFSNPSAFDGLSAVGATLLYATQIYCDFSGYSDMAIACGALLGYDLGRNFDAPYLSRSVTEFWRRWHISLSTWLRDYLYISLGGNRGGRLKTHRNLMATMVLGGLWHGAAWSFVVWGFLHGVALIIHKEWVRRLPDSHGLRRVSSVLGLPLTFWWACLAWVFFRATSLSDAWVAAVAWVTWQGPGEASIGLIWVPVMVGLVGLHVCSQRVNWPRFWRALPTPIYAFGWGAIFAILLGGMPADFQPFIYFQF
jgi:alginate O-acetyltransferase complex protein AlgI